MSRPHLLSDTKMIHDTEISNSNSADLEILIRGSNRSGIGGIKVKP